MVILEIENLFMDFYSSIHKYYDLIFPLKPNQLNFITEEFAPGTKILDIGCSTGELSLQLAKKSYQVYAIDLDSKMIELAISKNSDSNPIFQVANMLELNNLYNKKSFDGILCLGNTLVHLTDEKELNSFFETVNHLLKDDGKLIIQILNYDYITKENITSLPLIKNDKVDFKRNYQFLDNGLIDFETELKIPGNEKKLFNSIKLKPLFQKQLTGHLEKVGLKALNFYGDFTRGELKSNSLPLIVVAEKLSQTKLHIM